MYSPFRFIPSVFLKRNPIHLTVFLTKRCNARCPFCFYIDNSEKYDAKSELSIEEIKGLSSGFGNLLWLAFSGGEIFLREDIVEISRVFYENNRPSIMLYPTNGLLPDKILKNTEKILKNSPKSAIVVKLSIDGIWEKHDSLRAVKGGFNRVIDTYNALSPLPSKYPNFELGINTVFCSENQDHMEEIINFVKTLDKVKTHTISLIRGALKDPALKDVDMDKYLYAARRLEGDIKCRTYGFRGAKIKAAQDILQRHLIYKTVKENRQVVPCYAGRLNLVVTENGNVYPCENFKDDFLMGNIGDFDCDINRVLKSERAKAVLSAIGPCFCTHECYMMTNILFNPRMYHGLMREYFL